MKPPGPGAVPLWPDDMRLPGSIDRSIERLRISLLLAVQREARVQLVPTWRYFHDPFGHGLAASWLDPKNAIGIVPTKVTKEEVASWVEWYKALINPRVDRISLAITRILKAVAERREPADVLIDSVIAWEAIFGTPDGDPTLRVTASLAILLRDDVRGRKELRSRLSKIYRLRSDVVHGNRDLTEADYPLCQEALDIALRAVQVLTSARTDVLDLAKGADRSLHLILGGRNEEE